MDKDTMSSFESPVMMNKEDCNKPRGDSTVKAMASKTKEKEMPRYLRPSTGSCHDICKYGKKHIPVEKPWRSKIFKKGLDDDDLNEALMKPPGASKMKKVTDDSSEIIKRDVVRYQENGFSIGKKKQEALIMTSVDETPVKKMMLSSKSKVNVEALKPKVLTKSYSALATSKSKVNHKQGKDEDLKIKNAIVSSRVVSKKVPVTPRASLSPTVSIRVAGDSSLRKSQSLKASSSSSSRPNQKPRHVNLTDESNKQFDDYPVKEKTLHVVSEPFPPLPQTQSTENNDECTVSDTEEYEYPSGSNEAESEEDEIGITSGEKKPRANRKGDFPDEAAHKLKFRRGKVLDADAVAESARNLKFRRGRGLGEDKAQDAQGRRSFKKREEIREEEEDDNGEKVVLRHQDVQEKDAQGLFNNVIEETASKLVEARKSKVKALVGAFETVISLQESKPPTNSETGNLV